MRRYWQGRDEGYTLIELLVVLAILGLLATITTTQVLKYLGNAKFSTAHTEVESYATALDLFKLDVGRYPTTSEGLKALRDAPASADGWGGPYVKSNTSLDDPWGRPFHYLSPGEHGEYDLFSYGPDSQGAKGEGPPVRNWR
jgi:general secretion pathway protein G